MNTDPNTLGSDDDLPGTYNMLVYVFPATSLINVSTQSVYIENLPNFQAFILFFLLGVFLPLELISTNLWYRLRYAEGGELKSGALLILDIVRVFFLSAAYMLSSYIVYENKNVESVKLFWFFLSLFVCFNRIWHVVYKPSENRYVRIIKEKISLCDDSFMNNILKKELRVTQMAAAINIFFLSYIMPLFSFFIIAVFFNDILLKDGESNTLSSFANDYLVKYIFLLCFIFFVIQIASKTFQIYSYSSKKNSELRLTQLKH